MTPSEHLIGELNANPRWRRIETDLNRFNNSPEDPAFGIHVRVGRFLIHDGGLTHSGLFPAFVDIESLSDGDCVSWFKGRSYVREDEYADLLAAFFVALMYHGVTPKSAPWAAKRGADDLTVMRRWMAERKDGRARTNGGR